MSVAGKRTVDWETLDTRSQVFFLVHMGERAT
ncbi:hypothetical protein ABH922_005694 [Rhodococcus sp. 27YEA15]